MKKLRENALTNEINCNVATKNHWSLKEEKENTYLCKKHKTYTIRMK